MTSQHLTLDSANDLRASDASTHPRVFYFGREPDAWVYLFTSTIDENYMNSTSGRLECEEWYASVCFELLFVQNFAYSKFYFIKYSFVFVCL